MKKWILKAITQKTISYLPFSNRINFFFQKYVTKGVFLTDEYFENKIISFKDHLAYFKKSSAPNFAHQNVLELGTGWYPIVPIAMFLSGFEQVFSIDIEALMTKERQIIAIKKYMEWRKNGKLKTFLPHIDESKWNILKEILKKEETISHAEINQLIRLKPIIVDARKTNFEPNSIDFICSNNTFEHIPKFILKDILIEFSRILKPQGMMSHFIDMSDHFAHFDKTITIYNFLQFTEKQWDMIDNSIQPQNRMRFVDYKKMYKELNIDILHEKIRPYDINMVKNMKIAESFKSYALSDLAISHGYLVS